MGNFFKKIAWISSKSNQISLNFSKSNLVLVRLIKGYLNQIYQWVCWHVPLFCFTFSSYGCVRGAQINAHPLLHKIMRLINSTKRAGEDPRSKEKFRIWWRGAFCVNNKKEKVIVAKSEKDRRGTDRISNVRCIASSLFVCIYQARTLHVSARVH